MSATIGSWILTTQHAETSSRLRRQRSVLTTCAPGVLNGVERTLPRDVGIPTPYPIEGGRYVLTVCSPSFVNDPRGKWYFEDDDEAKPLIMNTLDYDAIFEFVETKLKEYTFTSTPDDPYGDDVEFRNVTKHWLYDADWDDYH